jgi:hypothetical protein
MRITVWVWSKDYCYLIYVCIPKKITSFLATMDKYFMIFNGFTGNTMKSTEKSIMAGK